MVAPIWGKETCGNVLFFLKKKSSQGNKPKNSPQASESCPVGLKHTLFSCIALALGSQGGQFGPPMLV